MIPAIVIGRGGSKGFPNKNKTKILGKELLCYPVEAAKNSVYVENVYFSTSDPDLALIAEQAGADIIDRPRKLSTDKALAEDVFIHAYKWIKRQTKDDISCVVLMFANAPCITAKMIDTMVVDFLLFGNGADSLCTVSNYNMFAVNRARIEHNGYMLNAVNMQGSNCDRNSLGDFYFYDCSCAVVSVDTMENMKIMPPPQPWLGRGIKPYFQKIPALDIDYEWQLGQIEYWLKHHKDN